jgi:competence protein ComQ
MTVWEQMDDIINQYVGVEDLKRLMKQSIQDKQTERTIWFDLTLCSHHMFKGNESGIAKLGAVTEIIILALDIMDDLQDQDNRAKVWMSWSPSAAMNVFLALLMSAFVEIGRTVSKLDHSAVLGEISMLILKAAQGQHMDTEHEIHTEEDYIVSVLQKSGSLVRLACYIGFASAGMNNPNAQSKLYELADCIGMMAQLDNDLRDVLRYDIKNDLLLKRKTLPILYLLKHSEKDFPLLKHYYDGRCSKEAFLKSKADCLDYIQASGCVEYTKVIQGLYYQKADSLLDAMDALPEWKARLKEASYTGFGA